MRFRPLFQECVEVSYLYGNRSYGEGKKTNLQVKAVKRRILDISTHLPNNKKS